MALSYKSRKRWSLLVLLVALPAYIVVAVTLVGLFERPPILLEMAIYIGLGVIWAFPLKSLFRGVGQPEPQALSEDEAYLLLLQPAEHGEDEVADTHPIERPMFDDDDGFLR